MTEKGKGVRTLEKIPKKSYVCEYAGELIAGKDECSKKGAKAS